MERKKYPRLPETVSHYRTDIYMDKFGVNGLRELVRVNFTKSDGQIFPHMHPDAIELCYIAKGRQTYCVEDREYKLRSGMVFVSHPNEWHHCMGHLQEHGVQLYYMILDVVNDTDSFLGMYGEDASGLAEEMKNLPYSFTAGMGLKEKFEEMFSLYFERPAYWRTQLKCVAFQLCRQLVMCARHETDERKVSKEVLSSLNYVEDHLTDEEEINIQDMADRVFLSLSQLNARFRSEIGITPKKYINRRRMELACDMLSDGKKVIEISCELGFSSAQHFSNAFRSYYGISPSQWREQKAQREEN